MWENEIQLASVEVLAAAKMWPKGASESSSFFSALIINYESPSKT